MIDRVIGLSGIAISVIAAFIPLLWPNLPHEIWVCGIFLGLLIMAFAFGLAMGERFTEKAPRSEWTSLKLQFYGDHRIPTEIVRQNVDSWYALWTESREISFQNAEGITLERVSIPKQWTIFIQLEKPTAFREVVVTFGTSSPPMYEVKATQPRYIVVFISSDVPPTNVEIYTKN